MYEQYFGFTSKPFALTPDPGFLFPSRQHSMALTLLEYGLESQAAFSLLTGEVGSGKTTLVRRMLRDVGDRVAVGLISNTHRAFRSIHPWAMSALSIVPADDSDIAAYEALVDACIREYARGRRTLLVVDEAQNLSIELLEELRLLSNVNSERDLILQVLLVGQPELRDKLSAPELRQFAQRISVDFHLRALDGEESKAYVRHRLVAAGGDPETFSSGALAFVCERSGGVPRLINQLCDIGLVYAYAEGRRQVETTTFEQVERDRGQAATLPVWRAARDAAGDAALTLSG